LPYFYKLNLSRIKTKSLSEKRSQNKVELQNRPHPVHFQKLIRIETIRIFRNSFSNANTVKEFRKTFNLFTAKIT